jgi:hypothetical protein
MTFLVSGPYPPIVTGQDVPRENVGLDHTVGIPGRLTYSLHGVCRDIRCAPSCCRGAGLEGKDDTGYSALRLDLVFISNRVNMAALSPRDLTCRQKWYRSPTRARRAISIPAP